MLVVVRHGRTVWNVEGRFQGRADVPLDSVGRRQSRETAAALSVVVGPPLEIVSSDLLRAAETASTIAGALGGSVRAEVELREVDVGAWEGLTRAKVQALYPDDFSRWSAGEDIRRGRGETRAEAGSRVAGVVKRLLAATTRPLIVVGHGVSLQAGLAQLGEEGIITLDGPPPHLGNGRFLALTTEMGRESVA